MTSSWMPSSGRHSVNIGPSLSRSIKARKLKDSPAPTTKRSNLPEREFFAFRYNFKPGSIDTSRPASIEVRKGSENTQIFADFPSKELNEVCTYTGTETPAKDVECILIYDEETGQYTLEKLDSIVSLQFSGKRAAEPSPEPSTSSTPSANATSPKGKAKQADDQGSERRYIMQEEEEEGEEIEIPLRLQVSNRLSPPSVSNPTTKSAGSKKVKTHTSAASSSFKNEPPQMSSSALPAPKKMKRKAAGLPETETASYTEEEVVEIERPVNLSLPGGKSTFIAPPSSISKAATNIPTTIPVTFPPGVSANLTMEEVFGDEEDDDDDEEWEAVPTSAPPPSQPEYDSLLEDEIFGAGFGEDDDQEIDERDIDERDIDEQDIDDREIDDREISEQEIDATAFEAELNEQMDTEDDGDDDDDMEPVIAEPMLMEGIVAGESDDEYSSSDSDTD